MKAIALFLLLFNVSCNISKPPSPFKPYPDITPPDGGDSTNTTPTPPDGGGTTDPTSPLNRIAPWTISDISSPTGTPRELVIKKGEDGAVYLGHGSGSYIVIDKKIGSSTTRVSTFSAGAGAALLDMEIYRNQVYIVYETFSGTYIKKLQGSSWVDVVTLDKTLNVANIEVHKGQLYIAYIDENTKIFSLIKQNGTTWESIGTANTTKVRGGSFNIQLVFYNDTPYISAAYNDRAYPRIFNLQNKIWVDITGNAGSALPSIESRYNMLIDKDGTIYIGYLHSGISLNGIYSFYTFKNNKFTLQFSQKTYQQDIQLYNNQLFTIFGSVVTSDLGFGDAPGKAIFNKISNDPLTLTPFPQNNELPTSTGQYPALMIHNNQIYILFVTGRQLKFATSRFI